MVLMEPRYYMAIDQYGNTEHGLRHPRKDLMQRCGTSHAQKMFIDRKDAPPIQIGYVVGRRWFTVYEVRRMEKPV